MNRSLAVLILIPASIVVLLAARRLQRWRTFGVRTTEALTDAYENEQLQGIMEFEVFCEVMRLVARCYSVPVEKLRVGDPFKTELGQVDSFSLDLGVESLVGSLEKQYPRIDLKEVRTIRDLLVAVAGEAKNPVEG